MSNVITSDLIVMTNGNDGTWGQIGTQSSAADTDYFVQGTGSQTKAVSNSDKGMAIDIGAGNELSFAVAGAEEDMLVYFWIQMYPPGLTQLAASAPGLTLRIAEGTDAGTDYAEWDVMFKDILPGPANEFFRVYVLDPRAPPSRTSGTWDYNNCRFFGAHVDITATSKGQNLGIDRICYGLGELKATGTSTDATSGLQEMIDENWGVVNDSVAIGSASTARNGIIQVRGQTAFCKGMLVIGDDAGTLATDLQAQDTKIEWEETLYYDSAGRVRSTIGYDDSQNYTGRRSDGTAYYGIKFVGNGTGNTDVTFGAAVGPNLGRSGPILTAGPITPVEIYADDGAVEAVKIFGTLLTGFRYLDFSANASTDEFKSNNVVKCGSLDIGPVVGRFINIISAIGGAFTFMESFFNFEATAAEQLSTADPTTEWTDNLNGVNISVPSAKAGYAECLDTSTLRNTVVLDDDKVGSDDHYAECVLHFPAAGSAQGAVGLVIACHATAGDYFGFFFNAATSLGTLVRFNTDTPTVIAGPTAFSPPEGVDIHMMLARSGTSVEARMTFKDGATHGSFSLTATDSAHTGTAQRLTGLVADSSTLQVNPGGRWRNFGTGPITDLWGGLYLPPTANLDVEDITFVNNDSAVGSDTAGTYVLTNWTFSGGLSDFSFDSAGLHSMEFFGGDRNAPNTGELWFGSTSALVAKTDLKITVSNQLGNVQQGMQVRYEESDGTLIATGTTDAGGVFTFEVDVAVLPLTSAKIIIRNLAFEDKESILTIPITGFDIPISLEPDGETNLP